MSSPIADGVLAATHRLVQQAMSGQWADVPRTIEERRVLMDRLTASATPKDQVWLGALRQAMVESDAAVERMTGANREWDEQRKSQAGMQAVAPIAQTIPDEHVDPGQDANAVDSLMEMIVKGR